MCWSSLLAVTLLCAEAAGAEGPTIELPPEEPQSKVPRPAALRLPRETAIEVPLDQQGMAGGTTAIGGYGELTLNMPSNSPAVVDLRRLVLYVGHNFTDRFRLYAELEVEHAVTSSSDRGEFEVEQAFLDYLAWRPFNVRAGVLIMPTGIINVYHEPSTFNGVDRPETDTLVIPSTWREPGLGFFGAWKILRYQAYVVNGFNANGFTASAGLRDGHQEAQLALGHDWGVVLRLDVLPFVGGDVGASYYFSHADQGQREFDGAVAVHLAEVDARVKWRGLEARAEIASVWIGGSARVNRALQESANMLMPPFGTFDGPVAHQLLGGYVEVGYNVLQPFRLRWGSQLVPFLRYEHVDTQFRIAEAYTRALGNKHDTITAGLTFRPIAEIALKFDYQRQYTDADVDADAAINRFNLGLAFMF
jgi:hypothetical protein